MQTDEEKVKEFYDIKNDPDADIVGGGISMIVSNKFPDEEDVKRWLKALEERQDQDNEYIKDAIYDCKFYLGF